MTNRLTLILAIIIAGLLALDHYRFDGTASLFLAKKVLEFITYIAFWR